MFGIPLTKHRQRKSEQSPKWALALCDTSFVFLLSGAMDLGQQVEQVMVDFVSSHAGLADHCLGEKK